MVKNDLIRFSLMASKFLLSIMNNVSIQYESSVINTALKF